MAVKFNDYFEFPKEFDLLPYTAVGLAQIEGKNSWCVLVVMATVTGVGEKIPDTNEEKKENEDEEKQVPMLTKYRLRGILVHSGQASGGHYYSFINVK